MLVSAISKINATKALSNSAYPLKNAFNGDNNVNTIDRCKPHYSSNLKTINRRFSEHETPDTPVEPDGKTLYLLA